MKKRSGKSRSGDEYRKVRRASERLVALAPAVEMPADSRQARGVKPKAIGDMAVVSGMFFYKNRFIGPVKGMAVNYDTVAATPLPFMSQDAVEAMLKAHREAEVTVNENGDVKVERR